jgi:beta-glucosidase
MANTGQRRGREVVQAYLSRPDSAVERPALWLAGFAAVTAEAGAEVEVTARIGPRAFQHWSTTEQDWVTEPGTFTLHIGRSSRDLPLTAQIRA